MGILNQPFTKDEKTSILLAVLISFLGYIAAIFTCDDVFARFGALVVCVGVYFASKGFSLQFSKMAEVSDAAWESNTKKILATIDSDENKIPEHLVEHAKAELLGIIKESRDKAELTVYLLEKRFIKIESYILIAGTLIWAFGDYFVPEMYSLCTQC
jgi:hypothetical protein